MLLGFSKWSSLERNSLEWSSHFHVVFGELVIGLGHPVRFVGPRSRDKVYLEAGFAKDLEGIKHFADEQSCLGHNASMLERGFVKAKGLFRNELPVSLQ